MTKFLPRKTKNTCDIITTEKDENWNFHYRCKTHKFEWLSKIKNPPEECAMKLKGCEICQKMVPKKHDHVIPKTIAEFA